MAQYLPAEVFGQTENRFQPYRDRSWMKKDQCGECKWFRYCQGGGMHLRDANGDLILCHLDKLK